MASIFEHILPAVVKAAHDREFSSGDYDVRHWPTKIVGRLTAFEYVYIEVHRRRSDELSGNCTVRSLSSFYGSCCCVSYLILAPIVFMTRGLIENVR